MPELKNNRSVDEGWDAWQAEMMKQSIVDYIPIASGLRCMYDALRGDGFTAYQSLELTKAHLTALLTVGLRNPDGGKNEKR